MKRLRLAFVAVLVAGLIGCRPRPSAQPPTPPPAQPVASGTTQAGTGHLIIVATNDLHGQLRTDTYSFSRGKPTGGAAVIAGYVADFARQAPVLLLDVGDFMQCGPELTMFSGEPTVAFMNQAGYRAAAVGNHESDWGIDVLARRAAQAKFPLLCANLLDTQTGQPFPFTKPSALIDIGGAGAKARRCRSVDRDGPGHQFR